MAETISITETGAIATVLIDNVDKRNALTKPMWQELGRAMAKLSAKQNLRCVILRGAGDGGFGAGADIHEFVREREGFLKARDYGMVHAEALSAVQNCTHPVIAAIEGPCMGASLILAAACDLRIAADGAKFALPPMKLGATLGYPELRILVDLIGRAPLMEMLLEGQVFDVVKAQQMNLLTRFVEQVAFEDEIAATTKRISNGAPLSQRLHKKFVQRLLNPEPVMHEEFDEGYVAFDSDDFKEGYSAFLEKRKPVFKGQ